MCQKQSANLLDSDRDITEIYNKVTLVHIDTKKTEVQVLLFALLKSLSNMRVCERDQDKFRI